MSAFYIWNPHLLPGTSDMLQFIITNGDIIGIAQDKRFFNMILKDIDIDSEVIEYTIEPCRSKYYSDYIGEEEWQDNWQLVWKVSVKIKNPLKSLPVYGMPYIPSNATGDNWLENFNITETSCLVISDFVDDSNLKNAQKNIAENALISEMQDRYAVGKPDFQYFEIINNCIQLQVNLGKYPDDFYAKGADYAEHVLSICRKVGGKINYQEIF